MTRGETLHHICKRRGYEKTLHVRRAGMAVAQSEGGDAKHNMWNTTRKMPGSTNYNSIGVQHYVSDQQGLEAVDLTFAEQGHGYQEIDAALRRNAPAKEICQLWGESDWGTSSKLLLEVWAWIARVPGVLRYLEQKDVAS